jgi:cysteinyl-tRNA synthetase
MSKSLGNFVTIREILKDWDGEVVRLCLLKEHYRKDCEYDADCFKITKDELAGIHAVIAKARSASGHGTGKIGGAVERVRERFFGAMDDDFNTHEAVFALIEFTEALRDLDSMSRDEGRVVLQVYGDASRILGVFDGALSGAG